MNESKRSGRKLAMVRGNIFATFGPISMFDDRIFSGERTGEGKVYFLRMINLHSICIIHAQYKNTTDNLLHLLREATFQGSGMYCEKPIDDAVGWRYPLAT